MRRATLAGALIASGANVAGGIAFARLTWDGRQ